MNLQIGNSQQSEYGGGGVGIHYLKTVKKASLGEGLFGYSKTFDGLGIYLNSGVGRPNSDTGVYENTIKGYFNNNDRQIDYDKDGSGCFSKFRNLPSEGGKPGNLKLLITY